MLPSKLGVVGAAALPVQVNAIESTSEQQHARQPEVFVRDI
jgi:hypothetical protein